MASRLFSDLLDIPSQRKIIRLLIGTDFSARDFFPGIPGRLCFKIIGHHMDNDCTSDNFIRYKLAGVEDRQCVSAAAKQRGKIPCVGRMRAAIRIPMLSAVGKCFLVIGTAAAFTFMDMEAMNMDTAGIRILGQCLDFSQDKCASPAWIQIYHTPDVRVGRASPDNRICLRRGF